MGWLLMLIAALPDIIELVMKIWSLIKKKPVGQRAALRQELYRTARKHVRNRKSGPVLKTAGVDVRAELESMLEKLA